MARFKWFQRPGVPVDVVTPAWNGPTRQLPVSLEATSDTLLDCVLQYGEAATLAGAAAARGDAEDVRRASRDGLALLGRILYLCERR